MLKYEIQSNVYSMTSRMITPFHYIIRSIFYSVCVLANNLRFAFMYKTVYMCFVHFEGYMVRIIIVNS
jgi:hypothetical protein